MQTARGTRYGLTLLKQKLANLSGEIVTLERKLAWARKSRNHLVESIKLFSPGEDISAIRPAKPRKRVHLFSQGQLSGALIDVLREAKQPLTAAEIVTAMIKELRATEDARAALGPRVRSSLHYLQTRKDKVTKVGRGRRATWKRKF